jgi:hypothetical protein
VRRDPSPAFAVALSLSWALLPIPLAAVIRRRSRRKNARGSSTPGIEPSLAPGAELGAEPGAEPGIERSADSEDSAATEEAL